MYLQMRPGGFECWLIFLRVKLWILARWESTEDIYRDLENREGGAVVKESNGDQWKNVGKEVARGKDEKEIMTRGKEDGDNGRGQKSRSEGKGKRKERLREKLERDQLQYINVVIDQM